MEKGFGDNRRIRVCSANKRRYMVLVLVLVLKKRHSQKFYFLSIKKKSRAQCNKTSNVPNYKMFIIS
jgi:hypothetical protein